MGYTHYYRQQRDYTSQEWERLIEAAKKIFAYCEQNGIVLENDNPTSEEDLTPIANEEMIWFNGQESLACETFVLLRIKEASFTFCKTRRLPYDLAVCMVLLSSNQIAHDVLNISSDGDFEELGPIIETWQRLFNKKVEGFPLIGD